ncbi:hypothetical protein D3C80_1031080 [compost metagenome]
MGQSLHATRQPCQVSKRLVVQIHADALALCLQCFRQLQCAETQAFLSCTRFGFNNGGTLCLLGRTQRKEIGRQKIGHGTGVFDIFPGITVALAAGAA